MSTKNFKILMSWFLTIIMIFRILPVNMLTSWAGESVQFTEIGLTYTTANPGSLVCVYNDKSYNSNGELTNRSILDSDKYTVKYTYNGSDTISQYFEVPDNAKSTDILTCTITDNETGNYEVRNIPIDDSQVDATVKIDANNSEEIPFGKYKVGETITYKHLDNSSNPIPRKYYYSFYKDGKLISENDMEYQCFNEGYGFDMKLDQEKVDQMQGHIYTIVKHYIPICTTIYAAHSGGTTGYYYGDYIANFVVGDVNYEVKAVYDSDTNVVTATLYINGTEQNGYRVKWYKVGEDTEIDNEVKTSSSYDYSKLTNADKGSKIYAKIEADRLYSNNWITSNEVEIPMNEDDVWRVMSAKLNPETPQVGRTVYIQNIMVKKGEVEKALPGWNYVKYEYSIDGGELQEIDTNSISIPSDAGGKELRVVITGKGLADDGETYIDSVELKAVVYDASMAKKITKVTLNNSVNYAHPGDEMPIVVLPEDATYKLEKYENNKKIGEILNPTENDLKRLVTEDDIGKQIRYRAVGTGLFYNSNVYSNTVTVISADTKTFTAKVVNERTGENTVAINQAAVLKITDDETGEELVLGEDYEVSGWKYRSLTSGTSYVVLDNSKNTLTQTPTQELYDDMNKVLKRFYVDVVGLGNYSGITKMPSIPITETAPDPVFTLSITSNTDPTKPGSVLTAKVLLDEEEITPDKGGDWDYIWKNEDGDVLQEGGKTYTAKTEDVGKKVYCEIVELNNLKSNEIPVVDDTPTEDELVVKDNEKPDTPNPSTTKPGNTLVVEFETTEDGINPEEIIYTWYVKGNDGADDEEIGGSKELSVLDELVGKKVYVVLTYPGKDDWMRESKLITVKADTEETSKGECNVIVTQGQSFTVTIPAFVSLNGAKKTDNEANFKTVVTADISGSDSITVEPAVTSFEMTERGGIKKALTATITGNKLGWRYAYDEDDCNEVAFESGIERVHKISVAKLSAGKWTGTFNWNITTTGNKIKDSQEYVKYRTYESTDNGLEYIEGSEVKDPSDAEETPWE